MKAEQEVDMYSTVLMARFRCSQFIPRLVRNMLFCI